MDREVYNDDALRRLFAGVEPVELPTGFNARLTQGVSEVLKKRKRIRERIYELSILCAATVLLLGTGAFFAFKYFTSVSEDGIGVDKVQYVDNVIVPEVAPEQEPDFAPFYEADHGPLFEMPRMPHVDISGMMSPENMTVLKLSLLLALGVFMLLVFDRLIRKRYSRRHIAEL